MTQKNEHTKRNAVDQQSKAFFKGGKFLWEKSEATVWSDIEAKIEAKPSGKVSRLTSGYVRWAVAASLLVLLGIGTFMRFYKLSIETNAGEHQLVLLPDDSSVDLNAKSSISYKPYWWRFNREIKFEGEAYFEVEK
ncbi:MAG: FecR family protein, partial [Prolixibacteraceae bacterium]|nr:FecR family protein [Prolixibacteraceae bacterium]